MAAWTGPGTIKPGVLADLEQLAISTGSPVTKPAR